MGMQIVLNRRLVVNGDGVYPLEPPADLRQLPPPLEREDTYLRVGR